MLFNGIEVIHEFEFKKNPKPQIIEKTVVLKEGWNTITVDCTTRSKPGEFFIALLSASTVPTKEYFIVGSYGRDRKEGGSKFDADISWRSDKYPNFQ
ncbi:MAG TPA: hypothetical protein PKN36_06935 [bacterium]|nr:hypothetical protein [bacterium]